MPLPRVQFSLRQMLIGMILAALCTYGAVLKQRSDWFRQLARYHGREWFKRLQCRHLPFEELLLEKRIGEYHLDLLPKYQLAANRPWSAVAPDPPFPTRSSIQQEIKNMRRRMSDRNSRVAQTSAKQSATR
jgi:hypothetical protein